MIYSWSVNLYDSDGDVIEDCILVHAGKDTILKFQDLEHLETFAKEILRSLPEIKENIKHEN
jgi:hypothetical protein